MCRIKIFISNIVEGNCKLNLIKKVMVLSFFKLQSFWDIALQMLWMPLLFFSSPFLKSMVSVMDRYDGDMQRPSNSTLAPLQCTSYLQLGCNLANEKYFFYLFVTDSHKEFFLIYKCFIVSECCFCVIVPSIFSVAEILTFIHVFYNSSNC